ncbi:N-formylglutamate amidohydrolase [Zavarzinia compransoris]|uniref:N-formylglutamate amidohydrolase n=1 Tax=Zavarzinia marina TaxID=2911065 RepID=UPI001F3BF609|nr:N-formylglutamate amidohydrolase [Zavarzinia marina]MCF4166425.1 N-formylglutamate amidohydrolase [Zavarzinia marina]
MPLLTADEPAAVETVNAEGSSPVVLLCDHASPRIPRALGDMGLTEVQRLDHIGWDIGAAEVARRLSALLDAPLVLAGYSRLVIDCNRPAGTPGSIPPVTGGVTVPGNQAVTAEDRRRREAELLLPYHAAITAILDARLRAGTPAVVLAIHSFTPFLETPRPWRIGFTYGRDRRLAGAMLDAFTARWPALTAGDNLPYAVGEATDYAMPVHGLARGLLHLLIEIRNDGVRDAAGQTAWAARIAECWRAVEPALARAGY